MTTIKRAKDERAKQKLAFDPVAAMERGDV